jgi:N utilization substance protein A
MEVTIDEDNRRASVTVSEDQQSLAIGRGGQNVRLAAKLTGWKIDIKSYTGESLGTSDESPASDHNNPDESIDSATEVIKSDTEKDLKEPLSTEGSDLAKVE